jgi:hypothetical protein
MLICHFGAFGIIIVGASIECFEEVNGDLITEKEGGQFLDDRRGRQVEKNESEYVRRPGVDGTQALF